VLIILFSHRRVQKDDYCDFYTKKSTYTSILKKIRTKTLTSRPKQTLT
ncbi:MAG: hypothetical protein ACI971_002126, partial [Colwellia sp.]